MSNQITTYHNLDEEELLHPYRTKAEKLVARMTLEEKAGLCSGKNVWYLKAVERLGLKSIMVSDGPHGLRKQAEDADNLGLGNSIPAVCFPTASALACSFDRELLEEVGKALGEECLQEGVSVVLGPGVNQKRSPLCGRNFEYFSEDPVVSGELAAAYINGVQSMGVGTSLKHFAVNNQEKRRMTINAIIDERTLRETYLKAFEIAIKKAKPWTVMCAYNRLNGEYCSENEYLLTKILREDWGYEGAVISDWGAVNDRVKGVMAGLDLEMPGFHGVNDRKLVEAVKNHILPEEKLNQAACRVTELILKGMEHKKDCFKYDAEEHHQLAVRAATETAVLLKNQDKLLPGRPQQKVAVIGAFAKEPRYQGAGSSKINPLKVDNALDALIQLGAQVTYAPGYCTDTYFRHDLAEENRLIEEACRVARDQEIVYLFAGLPEGYESEGFDRRTMSLPDNHNRLIEAVAACNPNTVVILLCGAPVELPWEDKVKSILLAYLGGEGGGKAIAGLLLGYEVPSGKLAETWPLHLEDTPCYHDFPGGRATVEYRESIYVGYRYYDTAEIPVRFPFGHGLSYSSFTYSDLKINQEEFEQGDVLSVSFTITNTGRLEAKETALVFVSHMNEKVFRPKKELKEFAKLTLGPGESKEVTISLEVKDFGYYNPLIRDWYTESGEYQILVGPSVAECPLQATFKVISEDMEQPDLRTAAPSYYNLSSTSQDIRFPDQDFEALYGKPLPPMDYQPTRPFHSGNTLEDIQHTFTGRLVGKMMKRIAKKMAGGSKEEEQMVQATIEEMPIQALFSTGNINPEKLLGALMHVINGHFFRGMFALLKRKKKRS